MMFVLHNSFFLWHLDDVLPLLAGVMPFAFSYYVGYCLLAALVMKLITILAWPEPGEINPPEGEKERQRER